MKLCQPNLPINKVKNVFISAIMPDIIKENLRNMGIETVDAPPCKTLNSELAYHPDIVVNNPKIGIWYSAGDINMNKLLTKGTAVLNDKYPNDCLYNCFTIGDTLYGGRAVAEEIVRECKNRIVVAQGYTKCSTVMLSETDFITSDPSVYKVLASEGKNVLKTTNEGILLNGFSCGFIGGCTGVLGNKILAVTGRKELLVDYQNVNSFCKNIGYSVISLSSEQPYDYGGILPITEEDY